VRYRSGGNRESAAPVEVLPYALEEFENQLHTEEPGRPCVFLGVLVPADRIPNTAVLCAPGVRHLVADLPQLWEKRARRPSFKSSDRAALERLRAESDASMNQLKVHEAKALK